MYINSRHAVTDKGMYWDRGDTTRVPRLGFGHVQNLTVKSLLHVTLN